MTRTKTAIIRADASTAIGIGHVMRMMALSSALIEQQWQVVFYCQTCPEHLLKSISAAGANWALLPAQLADQEAQAKYLAGEADRLGASLIVLDGYQFDEDYQMQVSKSQALTLILDDYQHCQWYHTDFILNQNPGTKDWHYRCSNPTVRMLLGTDYVLLRPQFNSVKSSTKSYFRLVITMGGGDEANISGRIVDAASKALISLCKGDKNRYQLTLICGSANPHAKSLNAQIEKLQKAGDGCHYELLKDVEEMAEIFSSASLVISAGGGTVWEVACLGVANMVVITAENQTNVTQFADQGAIVSLGRVSEINFDLLPKTIVDFVLSENFDKMPARAKSLIDGRGAQRVVEALEIKLREKN